MFVVFNGSGGRDTARKVCEWMNAMQRLCTLSRLQALMRVSQEAQRAQKTQGGGQAPPKAPGGTPAGAASAAPAPTTAGLRSHTDKKGALLGCAACRKCTYTPVCLVIGETRGAPWRECRGKGRLHVCSVCMCAQPRLPVRAAGLSSGGR